MKEDKRSEPTGKAAGQSGSWASGVVTSTRILTTVGLGTTLLFLGGFAAWAALAPLAGAAVAPGIVAAAGQNQRVQHLEGGIVREILVREGERVEEGQPLFKLDATAAYAQRNRLEKQLVAYQARAARLIAERDGADAVEFSNTLRDRAGESGLVEILNDQDSEFATRRTRHDQELLILSQRVEALREQIVGLEAQEKALQSQIDVVDSETKRKESLLARGLTNRTEYTQLLRAEADLIGQKGQSRSAILAAQNQMIEAKEQIARARTQRVEAAVSELNEIRASITDIEEQLAAANAVLSRIVVDSPSDGVVIRLRYNTIGSVVSPGDVLLELLPTNKDLMIEARLSPQDIDVVHLGQEAKLRFVALNTRVTPEVAATLTYVSADRLIDEATQQPYYSARLAITTDLPREIDPAQIYPGMPVETYIKTGDRTFFDYLVRPITDSFSRAFRET